MQTRTYASEPPKAQRAGMTVYLLDAIEQTDDGWTANVYELNMQTVLTMDEILADFDALLAKAKRAEMTVEERMAADLAAIQSQVEYTAIMTDTALGGD
ncbi:hypothetical protein AAY81_00955 [Denitrobacterium detoxificans]|uniref:Uncharacterized protein n=1 Tax=Denitrobacterium detoxificans TaxID=79604 RepID=A0A172RW72_9ACTN|nr:hypothetical protein [Denitrobacterium detoxificans]ANE21968.1 hypothetical protein AAY81_00955 [Denitrobacterium detoxificans]SEO97543.1 hypothetical protein SAMN02910314_01785 [Denitrobacterium detoxificans]